MVVTAFLVIFVFVSIVVSQLTVLAQNLPSYQYNLETKIHTIKEAQSGNSIFDRGARMFKRLNDEIGRSDEVERFATDSDAAQRIQIRNDNLRRTSNRSANPPHPCAGRTRTNLFLWRYATRRRIR